MLTVIMMRRWCGRPQKGRGRGGEGVRSGVLRVCLNGVAAFQFHASDRLPLLPSPSTLYTPSLLCTALQPPLPPLCRFSNRPCNFPPSLPLTPCLPAVVSDSANGGQVMMDEPTFTDIKERMEVGGLRAGRRG